MSVDGIQSIRGDLRTVINEALQQGHSPDELAEAIDDECSALNAARRLDAIVEELSARDDLTAVPQGQDVGDGYVATTVRLVVDVDDVADSLSDGDDGTSDAATDESPEAQADGDAQSNEGSDEERTLEERIAGLLAEHGELPSSEIEFLLEVSNQHYFDALSSMQRDGRVRARKDPEDRRRSLYRLAGEDTGNEGEDAGEEPDASAFTSEEPIPAFVRIGDDPADAIRYDSPTATDESDAQPWDDEPRAALEAHLLEQVRDGETYVKESRDIAEDVPLNSHQIGHYLRGIDSDELEILYRKDDDWARGRWRYSLADTGGDETPDANDQDDHRVGDELPEDVDDQDDQDESDDEDDARLPEGVTQTDLETARESHDRLVEIADELDVSKGTARAALVHADLYSGVREGRRTGAGQ